MPKAAPAPQGPPAPPEHRPGQTTPIKDGVPAHKEPYERDESSASQQSGPRDVIRQAHDDVERGLADTSRAEATDQTYARNLRSEPQDAAGVEPKPRSDQTAGKKG